MPSISVIIPAYNRAQLLPATLRSLIHQTVPADEIIVVDDGSTDGTAEVAESFGNPVRVIRQANAGPGAARNRGFAESTGEFIHFFDSDDVASLNKHEVQLQTLLETNADISYCPWVKGLIVGNEFIPESAVLQKRGLPRGNLIKALLTSWSVVPHACLFKRQIVEKAGGFPTDITAVEDQMMFLRCLLQGARVAHSAETLEFYRMGDPTKLTSQGHAQRGMACSWARYLLSANEEVCERGGYNASVQSSIRNYGERSEIARHAMVPSQWFGFRLRTYEAHKDLENFFPHEHNDLKASLKRIHFARCEAVNQYRYTYELSGWWHRKLSGVRERLRGVRARSCFRAQRFSEQDAALFPREVL
ncbi:MAG TPA: hypothetical protein DDZ51_08000 [Planctomycetaceae bacterium]|nr:hypothetical protein [Planctomycetaceae bacterium]